ncbi:uridine-cytidine kinase-like 1 [Dysidea avara]|uniref:uridine-cytidine kinase-like 1 n=1 Tax=Dysidea avara TaxID=196820 RepID=UPI0033263526
MTSDKLSLQITISSSDSNSSLEEEETDSNFHHQPTSPTSPRKLTPGAPKRKRRTVYTAGRPPWYNSHGEVIGEAFVIGLAGGSASGKTTVATRIIESLGVPWVSVLSMDSFYKVLNSEQNEKAARNEYNFDHPDALDFDLMVETLRKLKEGKHVEIPVYDFSTHSRAKYTRTMYGANVLIFEGILSFTSKDLRELMDMKVFVDTDSDIRLARRLRRDISERKRDLEGVLKQYNKFVKPAFEQYIEPSMQYADIVVPRGAENHVAMNLIVQHVRDMLTKRGVNVRSELHLAGHPSSLPTNFHLLQQSNQVIIMHTIIRNKITGRDEFIFYTNRLACLLVEYALSFLPHQDTAVTTPAEQQYQGRTSKGKLCAVSILRAGEVLEPAIRLVCRNVKYGKILIQTSEDTGEPQLHFVRLPSNLDEHHVILCDATVATGAAALMAIRVLLDHDVPEENIIFISVIAANPGVHSVAYAFPKVKVISTALDDKVNDQYHIIPGIGNFGDRYFGTG